MEFSKQLQDKITHFKQFQTPVELGRIKFESKLILAPLAGITSAPFRMLMEDLGAGGTVSELISCHAICHKNLKTINMLTPDKRERNLGIQIFGEDPTLMKEAALIAESYNPKFIDINMGCPVRKVVTKGAGAGFMQTPEKVYDLLAPIKKELKLPLTVKIRTGWDEETLTAKEVMDAAIDSGVEFIALHGRTRSQGYSGYANWDTIERLAKYSSVPFIGNGDLHTPLLTSSRMSNSNCDAFMLGRGPLRNPFLFLESLEPNSQIYFTPSDYLEIINMYKFYLEEHFERENAIAIQLKKTIVWFAAGYPGVAQFRREVLSTNDLKSVLDSTIAYFSRLEDSPKIINLNTPFLAGGHG